MSSIPAPSEIVRDARWLAQALDPGAGMVRLVEMDREAYRSSSFLDDRMLEQNHRAGIVPWAAIAGAIAPDARRDARWIFHIGHVGSTLVSRLLGELGEVLSLREPRILRDLALTAPEQRAPLIAPTQALVSRTFAPSETAVVKATSMCSEIAGELMPGEARALFLFARPRAYIATILAGENSWRELEMMASSREQRLAARGILLAGARESHAHLAAMAWACEMSALEAASEARLGAGIAWCEFDAMLGEMTAALGETARHLGLSAAPEQLNAIAAGPLMHRYSKAMEYEYSPQLRQDLLREAAAANGADIDSAMAMLEAAAAGSPLLARALERGERRMECIESCPS